MKGDGNGTAGIGWYVVPLSIALGACAGDTLSLGEEEAAPAVPPGSRCATSTTVEGTVIVYNQANLDALVGCEAIEGNLEITQFAGADLRPLASLRSVGGDLYIGQTPSVAPFWPVLEEGWLDSFEGLEALERVGALVVANVNAPHLRPLESLHYVNANATGSWRTGNLVIEGSNQLLDLRGLENLQGVTNLHIVDNDVLESLDGLSLPFRLEDINLLNNPRLSNIDALANVRNVDLLQIANTGVRDLAALSELGVGETISIAHNARLVDVSALPLWPVRTFAVEDNPKLDGTLVVPEPGNIVVVENAELDRIVFEKLSGIGSNWAGGALQTRIFITNNASLSSIDFGGLTRCAELAIGGNDNLSQIEMPVLEGAVVLEVVDNPRLVTAPLAGLQTLERQIIGNAD